jgi:hypothetical protein
VVAGDVSFHRFLTVADAAGAKHAAFDNGIRWSPLGAVQVAQSQVTADVAVAAGTTQPVISATASFAGLGQVCELVLDMPEVEFSNSPGGECTFSVTLASVSYVLGHCSVKGPFAWPCRLSRQLAIPGAGSYSFAVSCTSLSQPVTLHADTGASYGPVSMSVAVVG